VKSVARPNSLRAVAKLHWRSFFPIWVFPVFFFASSFVPLLGVPAQPFFLLVLAPAAAVCFYVAAGPWRQGRLTFFQAAFCLVLVPFLVWVLVVGGFWGLLFAGGVLSE
jgi:hypothetical protein